MRKLVAFFFLFLMSVNLPAQLNINHYMRVGQTRISIGNYTGAIEYFNIVIKFKPYIPEPYFYRGVAKHRLEDFRGAIADYDKAIEIKPYYPDAYVQRGMAYHELNDYKNAISNYNKALELDPKNEGVYNNRGIAKISQKDVEGAIADYNQALEINPQSTTTLMNRSNAKIVNADIRGAIQDLNRVIIIRPHFASAYLNRGLARFELNDYASALRDYDQCIRLEPENALAYNNRGIVKHKLEDYHGAIMDYNTAIKLDGSMANAYFNRAMAREILGRQGFESDYQIAADLNPQYDLSRFKINAEELAKQVAQQQKQQKNTTQQQQQQSTAGNTNVAQNQPDPAKDKEQTREEELRRRRRLNLIVSDNRNIPGKDEPKADDGRVQNRNFIIDLQPLFIISALEKNSGNYDRQQYYTVAIESLNKVNNYNPLLAITNKRIDGLRNMFENSILFFNEKIRIAENSHNLLNRGIFYILTGNFNAALTDLNKAIQLEPTNALSWFSRANVRYKMIEYIESLPDLSGQMVVSTENSRARQSEQQKAQPTNTDYQLVLDDYAQTLKLNPKFIFGYYNRAFINLKLKKYDAAIADLDTSIELEPEFAEAYYNRGLTKIFMDDVDGGAVDLSIAGELGLVEAYAVIKRYCN